MSSIILTSIEIRKDKNFSDLSNLGEQIIRTFVFIGCEVLIEGVVLKENFIPFEMWDFDVILDVDWLSIHQVSEDYFYKECCAP